MKRLGLLLGTALALLTVPAFHVSAATVEDVYRAMEEVGMPKSFIQDTKNQFHNTEHDENGMELNGEYRSYEEWETLILENGTDYVFGVIAEEFCVDKDALIAYYMNQTAPPDEPSVTTTTTTAVQAGGTAFADMTLEEKKAYVMTLSEDDRIAFLAALSAEERSSILKQLDRDKQQQAMQGMADLAGQMGMHVTVDDIGDAGLHFSVRDENGDLLDSTTLGLSVDATGWDTTLPVLLASGMTLSAAGGILYLTLRCKKREEP